MSKSLSPNTHLLGRVLKWAWKGAYVQACSGKSDTSKLTFQCESSSYDDLPPHPRIIVIIMINATYVV